MAAGVPCSRYLTVAEAIADPQTVERGTMARIEDGGGPLDVPNAAFKFGDGSVGARCCVPMLGEHTRDVLQRILGMTERRIGELAGSHSIGLAT
jgi:crotonobetainyl-CoA:carnitine CoA-transferase CaiB-like acyl-CoA transferase